MKYIKLDCKRGGKERGAILSVGPKGDITLEEAGVLISERMASEYIQPVVSEVDTEEVNRLSEALTVSQSEVNRLSEENAKMMLTASGTAGKKGT